MKLQNVSIRIKKVGPITEKKYGTNIRKKKVDDEESMKLK